MKQISIIAAIATDRAIGRHGDQLFYFRDDLRHFKNLTSGHPVIMGRKTFQALPKGALPNRRNIVVTHDATFSAPNVDVASSLTDAIALLSDDDHAFIIGGGQIYNQAIALADNLYITLIDATVPDCDTFFPTIDPALWRIAQQSDPITDPATNVSFRFVCYSRR
jgi:dihydrofolate reductase